jgi:hypothetical protein
MICLTGDSPILFSLVVFTQQWQQYCTYQAELLHAGSHGGIKQIRLFVFVINNVVAVVF